MSHQPPLIQCQGISCIRDSRVLFTGLDCLFDTGDIVQIEGPNGTGKTTLLRALTGLFADYTGTLLWRGEPISEKRFEWLSNMLFIGHLAGVKKSLTPRENLRFLANLQGSISDQKIDDALAEVGLYGYEDMPGYQLSAGQNRRIALARLYVSQSMVWVLDEPYTALDTQGIAKLEALFESHAAKGGCVILTSHQAPNISGLKRVSLLDYQATQVDVSAIDDNEDDWRDV